LHILTLPAGLPVLINGNEDNIFKVAAYGLQNKESSKYFEAINFMA